MNAERKGEIILKATEKVIRGLVEERDETALDLLAMVLMDFTQALVEARKQFEGGFDISLN